MATPATSASAALVPPGRSIAGRSCATASPAGRGRSGRWHWDRPCSVRRHWGSRLAPGSMGPFVSKLWLTRRPWLEGAAERSIWLRQALGPSGRRLVQQPQARVCMPDRLPPCGRLHSSRRRSRRVPKPDKWPGESGSPQRVARSMPTPIARRRDSRPQCGASVQPAATR